MFITIKGRVKHGQARGRRLGFPTINLPVPREIKKEQYGIYFSLVKIGDKFYPGATHLGPVKSFNPLKKTCETYLLTFNQDLYDVVVEKKLIFKLREIENFPDVKVLKRRIKQDIKEAKKFFGI